MACKATLAQQHHHPTEIRSRIDKDRAPVGLGRSHNHGAHAKFSIEAEWWQNYDYLPIGPRRAQSHKTLADFLALLPHGSTNDYGYLDAEDEPR